MSPRTTVLVVEDEIAYLDALPVGLAREGFNVEVASDGAEALEMFDKVQPDLVLLDVMLPTLSGIDVCREIRSRSRVPIIMVTARSAEIDVVVGLEVGADDYVSKPYRLRELVARIRAVMRRFELPDDGAIGGEVLNIDGVHVDIGSREVSVRDEIVALPLKEFELLVMLMENVGRVLPRSRLIEEVWGYDYVGDTKTLDVHIKRLRAKIEDDPAEPARIITVRGVGYKYAPARRPL